MRTISIENIEDGQILAEPVVNKYGQTIMPTGASLSKSFHSKFKMWNVVTVTIESEQQEDEVEINIELYKAAEEQFYKRCFWKPRNSNENDVIQIGLLYIIKELKSSKGTEI